MLPINRYGCVDPLVVIVDCDEIGRGLFAAFTLNGRVDILKRVEIWDSSGQRRFRCSRLMYRFIDVDYQQALDFYGFGPRAAEESAG